ncbi:hypothetical protein NE237_002949 [Protea cynaroides]|uniref:Fe2OG dioxygenase domain-containing protein n=1 Tax=Protea cynaroides TaxID=273540 RepID=A0A9Q0QRZ6_9MAGN|nr:hypothetical protein NE237_002949 [Protea cynaroides]
MGGKENLKDFIVGSVPTVIYIPNFISDSEETNLLNNIYKAPISKWKSLKNRRLQNWGGVVHEKGLLPQDLPPWLTKITQKICEETELFPSAINHVLINEYLPDQGIMPHQDGPAYFPVVAIVSLGSPVVMNFTPHTRLRECASTITTNGEYSNPDEAIEVGANKWLDNQNPFSVLLMPRSLLIFKDNSYSDYLHGIADCNLHRVDEVVNVFESLKHHVQDHPLLETEGKETEITEQFKIIQRTSTRVSLTCRLVLKVHKNLFKF